MLLLFGIGGLGYFVIVYVKVMGLNIIVIDIDDKKLELVKIEGVNYIFNVNDLLLIQEIKEIINGGVYVVINILVFVILVVLVMYILCRVGK